MDEHIVVDRRQSMNVWTDGPDVCIAIDEGDKAQIRLNLTQAKKLRSLLDEAIAELRED